MRVSSLLVPIGALGVLGENPIKKVLVLLEDMNKVLGEEAARDKEIFTKAECWCNKSEKKVTSEVEEARSKLEELQAEIETQAGIIAGRTQEIANLKSLIAKATKQLQDAENLRAKEKKDAEEDQAEYTETVATLQKALIVLGKVQNTGFVTAAQSTSLLQLHSKLTKSSSFSADFGAVLQKDLWDMLGSIPRAPTKTGFLQQEPEAEEEEAAARDYASGPKGPEDVTGAAAGVKSYNNRSGAILGMLKQMSDDFSQQLADSKADEKTKEEAFAKLRESTQAQIAEAKAQKAAKSGELGDAKGAKSDAATAAQETRDALSEDEQFLLDTKQKCGDARAGYTEREVARGLEQKAVHEAISVLTSDESRETFQKTYSFVQVVSTKKTQSRNVVETRKRNAVMTLLQRAKQGGDARVASYAILAQLDKFPEAKKALNGLKAELHAEQKQEFATRDTCIADLQESDNHIADLETKIEDLEAEIAVKEQEVETGTAAIEALQAKIAETQQAVADATAQRKEDNAAFAVEVDNQKATVKVLAQAIGKLESFYGKLAMSQVSSGRDEAPEGMESLSTPVAKNQAGPGVIGLLKMIQADAEHVIKTASADEQKAQTEYEKLIADYSASLKTDNIALGNEEGKKARAIEAREMQGQQLSDDIEQKNVETQNNKALHEKCDFLMKNFAQTQEARAADIESIDTALAILNGAKFD